MTLYGKGKAKYKGVEYELNGFMGYKIGYPVNIAFQPYAGNKLLNYDCETIERLLIRRIKYAINKKLKQKVK